GRQVSRTRLRRAPRAARAYGRTLPASWRPGAMVLRRQRRVVSRLVRVAFAGTVVALMLLLAASGSAGVDAGPKTFKLAHVQALLLEPMTAGADGTVWIALGQNDANNWLGEVGPSGPIRSVPVKYGTIDGLTATQDGSVWFSSSGANFSTTGAN